MRIHWGQALREGLGPKGPTHAFFVYLAASGAQLHPRDEAHLVHSGTWSLRYAQARNPNTSMAALEQLSHDGNVYVRAVARHILTLRQPERQE